MDKKFFIELLKCYSPSGKERNLGKMLSSRLKKNFKIIKQQVNNNFNILASIGKPVIFFAAHLDTVPGNLRVYRKKNIVYGRGACDTKSQIYAMISAAERAINEGLSNLGLIFTVGEETDFAGAKKIISLIPSTTKVIVVGEPTQFKAIIGQKGLLTIDLTTRGKSAHGSTPKKGINAIELLMQDLQIIRKLSLIKNPKMGESVLNIGTIQGGISGNVVPDEASARIEIRNTVKPEIIICQIRKAIKNSKLQVINSFEPIFFPELSNLAKVIDLETSIYPAFTEQYFFSKKAKTIVLGINKRGIHSKDERANMKEIDRLSEIYYWVIKLTQERNKLGKYPQKPI